MICGQNENIQILRLATSAATNATASSAAFDMNGYKAGKMYVIAAAATATNASAKFDSLTLEYSSASNAGWVTQFQGTTNTSTTNTSQFVISGNNNTSLNYIAEFNFVPRDRYYRVVVQGPTGYNTTSVIGFGYRADEIPSTAAEAGVVTRVTAAG
jgi:hypothetical protein